MRFILAWSVGALLIGASTAACVDQDEQPSARTRAHVVATPQPQPRAPAGSTVIVRHENDRRDRGVTAAQPNTPAVINNIVTTKPPESQRESQPPPTDRLSEERARVSQAVALATQQIDRLTRIEESADPDRRMELEDTLGDLKSRREKLLQDMQELEIRGPAYSASMTDTLRSEMDRDLADLQSSIRDSYTVAPPPGRGMPPPAPLPPGPLH